MKTTNYELALLCKMATSGENKIRAQLKGKDKATFSSREKYLKDAGWLPLATSEQLNIGKDHGYYGVAYYRIDPITKQAEVVIAHRGTCFTEIGNVVADIELAQRKHPAILEKAAFAYMDQLFKHSFFLQQISAKKWQIDGHPVKRIVHTGFSLGGFIAGACAALSQYPGIDAVTFDAPGIDHLLKNHISKHEHIKNYVMRPNLVNTTNLHIGDVLHVPCLRTNKNAVVDFELHLNDWGIAPMLSDQHTMQDFDAKIAYSKKQQLRNKSFRGCLSELPDTLESHDLNLMIDYMEEKQDFNLETANPVFSWPSARNEFLYGKHPAGELSSMTFLGGDDGWSLVLNLILFGVQVVKTSAAGLLWELTKQMNERGEMEGVVGIRHKRSNKICYTAEEAQAQRANIPKDSKTNPSRQSSAQLMTARNDSLFRAERSNGTRVKRLTASTEALPTTAQRDIPSSRPALY